MKIAILTLGTRGDVQPYAVLGRALKRRGHEVVLSTAKNFGSLVRQYELDFVPVEADFQALLDSEEGKKIRKNPFAAKKEMNRFVYPMMADAFKTFYNLAKGSDRVLFHIKTMADTFADRFPEKMIRADVVPASQPTREFSNPVFSFLSLPNFMNRMTFKITALGLKMWTKTVNDFRATEGLPLKFQKPDLPSIYGISELFLKKPADFPTNSFFTGFWTDNGSTELALDVVEFIHQGDPPLAITFGSMPFESKSNIKDLVKAVSERLATRVVLIKGWGLTDAHELQQVPNVKVIDAAPHSKLFPLVKAVVHHGGIGTTAACLKAGKPFFICPVLYPLGDQHFWGTVAYKKGVGLKPVPLKKMTTEIFVANVAKLLNDDKLRTNAERLSVQLANEDGVANAIEIIERGTK
ncbi:MAG TPA: glycosyltransferase [Chitinophagales bacterium]|nr:glycosyltransferase [Chitinophagales bacterium]